MKVVLSRKGFDSEYGRVPSPILPNGRMISLPIPDKDAPISYAAISRDGINLGDLVTGLGGRRGKPSKPILSTDFAHLDPDVEHQGIPRQTGWRPIFGQSGAALGHLTNEGIGIGDLFLFFGWFRPAESAAGRWCYIRGRDSVHSLWGWLQVGGIHAVDETLPPDVRRWAAGHPHLEGPQPANNTVIVASQHLVVAGRRLPGAGTFGYDPKRVLTEPGSEKRGIWRMPAWMQPETGHTTMSYHGDPRRWSAIDDVHCRLRAADKGQEFVIRTTRADLLEQWLADIFSDMHLQNVQPHAAHRAERTSPGV